MKTTLETTLNHLMHHYGPLHWWPAENDIEMMLGAVLVQNTNWTNVEKALQNFNVPFEGQVILNLPLETLQTFIRPSGFYTRKSTTIHGLLLWYQQYDFDVKNLEGIDTPCIRNQLLSIKGIGKETADCILLYAFNRPVFVVDAYLKRILKSLGLFHTDNYDVIQQEMMDFFGHDVTLYQELHACIVEHGKQKTPIDAFDLVSIPNKVYLDVMNREPKFKEIHDTYGYVTRISHPDPYTGFVYTIIGQLLSAASAHAIFTRFIHRFPDVASVNQASLQQVMDLGLTHNKACAIKSLCEKVSAQKFSFEYINTLSDEHAIEALTKLKGLGRWSAIIILIHTYNRLNLTSYDDIALRKSVARILKVESVSKTQFDRYMARFEPYKSVASIFLWKLNKLKD